MNWVHHLKIRFRNNHKIVNGVDEANYFLTDQIEEISCQLSRPLALVTIFCNDGSIISTIFVYKQWFKKKRA